MDNKERLRSYVRRQIELCDEILGAKIKVGGKILKTRNIYIKICEYIKNFKSGKSDRRWVIIPGLRGTGKTTVLAQSYFFIKDLYPNASVIYFSIDDAMVNGFSLIEVIDTYMEEIGQKPETTKDVFIMLDEVQNNYDWAKILKTYHDKSPGVFLLCSGSSAVNLQSNADVAGRRAEIECLYPMSFCEYEMVEHGVYKQVLQTVEKIIYKDLPQIDSIMVLLYVIQLKLYCPIQKRMYLSRGEYSHWLVRPYVINCVIKVRTRPECPARSNY